MSDLFEYAVNFYHLRLIPTVKRMLDRRRLPYTLLTVGVFLVSAAVLSLLLCHTAASLADHARLSADYENYLIRYLEGGRKHSPIPEMRDTLVLARAGEVAVALLCGILWLMLAAVAVGWLMNAVVESEAYVYGLYMIYGADRKRLARQFSVEFFLAGIPALAAGIPTGFGLYRLSGGTGDFPLRSMLPAALCFLALILLCARILSARVLKRPCMGLLNTSDTSDITVSPRRSRLTGLTRKRTAPAAAGLSLWRLRRHYMTLALAVLLVTAPVFVLLSPMESPEKEESAFTLTFPEGVDNETLTMQYLTHLQNDARIASLGYGVADKGEALGLHVLADHAGIGDEAGLPLGERYVTDSFRIACGDGDTFHELGGNLVIPEDRKHIPPPNDAFFGYQLDAVPAGCAAYVYPEGTTPPLSLHVGDVVRLYLPSDRDDLKGEYVTVRISQVVAVPSLRGERGGPEICPRITEDYLYLSPFDYEKFHGQSHARGFVAEEAYAPDFFPDGEAGSCILVIPRGNAPFSLEPASITVISPVNAVKAPFRDSVGKESMPDSLYFINHTSKGVGVYMGSKEEYLQDHDASEVLHKAQKQALQEYVGNILPTMETREYRVEQIIYTEGGSPYVILPHAEINFSALQNDLCAFRLNTVNRASPHMTVVAEESYLLETNTLLGASFFGRACYVGTALLPAFTTAMEAEGLQLQFSEDAFLHTKTRIGNSFSRDNRYYLLADLYPYEKDMPPQPRLQADYYPRVITGVGSFCHLGDTEAISFLEVSELGARGLFTEDSIGTLKAESRVYPGQYAYNDWVISPDYEASPDTRLTAGHAILFTPDPNTCPVKAGDILSVALRQDTAGFLSDPQFVSLQLRGEDLLPYLMERITYPYFDVVVDEVRQGEGLTLTLCETDLSTALGTAGLYRELRVDLADGGIADYLDVYTLLTGLTKAEGNRTVTKYHPQYVVQRHAASVMDPTGLRLTGLLAVCLIPLLLAAAQFVFFAKRTEEFSILRDMGIPPSLRRKQLILETLLASLLMGLCAALACPVGYLLLLILGDALGISLPMVGFDLHLCGQIALLTALSCTATGIPAYLRAGRERPTSSDST